MISSLLEESLVLGASNERILVQKRNDFRLRGGEGFRPCIINCFEIVLERGGRKEECWSVDSLWVAPQCVPIIYLLIDHYGRKGARYTNPFMFAVSFVVFMIHRSETSAIGASARYVL